MPIAKLPEEQQQVSDIGYLLLVCEVSLAPVPHGSPFQCFTFFFFKEYIFTLSSLYICTSEVSFTVGKSPVKSPVGRRSCQVKQKRSGGAHGLRIYLRSR